LHVNPWKTNPDVHQDNVLVQFQNVLVGNGWMAMPCTL